MASTLLRLGRPNEAEDILDRCPSPKDFTDNTFLHPGYPHFAVRMNHVDFDIVLLSKIRDEQGRAKQALRL
ncbi:hypothetical protein K431DRAFT_190544, partial [Polychaeton citri CBS 116435]